MSLGFADRWVWDFWPAYDGDRIHLFYLQAPRSLVDADRRHLNATVGHASSTNLVDWRVHADAIIPGPPGSWDSTAVWTGSVARVGCEWIMLYTGVSTVAGNRTERVGLATSTDLETWRKSPHNPVIETDVRWYEAPHAAQGWQHGWRDPFVRVTSEGFEAFVSARVNEGPTSRRGSIARATSHDAVSWVVHPPAFAPGRFPELEVPFILEIEGEPLLFVSTRQTEHDADVPDPLTVGTRYIRWSDGGWSLRGSGWLDGAEDGSTYTARPVRALGRWWMLRTIAELGGEYVGMIDDPIPLDVVERNGRRQLIPRWGDGRGHRRPERR